MANTPKPIADLAVISELAALDLVLVFQRDSAGNPIGAALIPKDNVVGKDGTVWHFVSGPPSNALGKPGDIAFDRNSPNGDVRIKGANNQWGPVTDTLRGPPGLSGAKGDPGSSGFIPSGTALQRPNPSTAPVGTIPLFVNTESGTPLLEAYINNNWQVVGGTAPAPTPTITAPTDLTAVDTPGDTGGSNTLAWTPSPSSNVVSQEIARKDADQASWSVLVTILDNTTAGFVDNTARTGVERSYRVVAVASDGTRSSPSNVAVATARDNTPPPSGGGGTMSAPAVHGDAIKDYPAYRAQLGGHVYYGSGPTAFMNAQGYGATAVGFRSSTPQIRFVTHLNDTTDTASTTYNGSFRKAVETPGPAIVIPIVAGLITAVTRFNIRSGVYVAGQAAPAPGLTITTNGYATPPGKSGPPHLMQVSAATDVVLRFLRLMKGPGGGGDCLNVLRSQRVVADHLTTAYGTDENIGIWNSHSGFTQGVTFSRCMVSDPLNISTHPDGPHGKNSLIGDEKTIELTLLGTFGSNAEDRGVHFIKTGGLTQVVNTYGMNARRVMRISNEEAGNDTTNLPVPLVNLIGAYFDLGDWLRNVGKVPSRPVRVADDSLATNKLPRLFIQDLNGYDSGNENAGQGPEGRRLGSGNIEADTGFALETAPFPMPTVRTVPATQAKTEALAWSGSFRHTFETRIVNEATNNNGPDGRSDSKDMIYQAPPAYPGINVIGGNGREAMNIYTQITSSETWRTDGLTAAFATQQGLVAGDGLKVCPDGSGRLWVEVMLDKMALDQAPI